MTQSTQNEVTNKIIETLTQHQETLTEYMSDLKECFDENGNVQILQFIGVLGGLPYHLDKIRETAITGNAIANMAREG